MRIKIARKKITNHALKQPNYSSVEIFL